MTLQFENIPSPIGEIILIFEGETLRALDFSDYEERMKRLLRLHYGPVTLTPGHTSIRKEIDAFFEGDLGAITRVKVQTNGTAFQRKVWQALTGIKEGTTATYGELAVRIGHPAASRAVGAANGANPVAIVVPCHRVIGASGDLTGYGGGLDRKKWLLAHESRTRVIIRD
jgi:methylated-DNA-[protein]-cysteine S-methyltransferase